MIILTGTAGFIGSVLLGKLNKEGYTDILIVDDFSRDDKNKNIEGKKYSGKIQREDLFNWLKDNNPEIEFVFHIGARTDTAEFDWKVFEKLNINYSKDIWNYCVGNNIPLLYASSAATYGMGELGYKDDHEIVDKLKPLNPYGKSKNEFDKWVLKQEKTPPFWAGMKFFNVYGPNEYHKSRMASVIFHAFNQIQKTGLVKLFRSHNPDFEDGKQVRDFIYVKDVVEIMLFMMHNKPASGLYNLGTGTARSFLDLTRSTFAALHLDDNIQFIDTPEDIRDKYQYFTEADMDKLKKVGYSKEFRSLEDGVKDYVTNYLTKSNYY